MIRTIQFILLVILVSISSCDHLKKHFTTGEEKEAAKTVVTEADKIVYTHRGPTVAPKYNRGYTLTITPEDIVVSIKSYDEVLLTKRLPFTEEKFISVVHSFKKLKQGSEPGQDEIPVGGGSEAVTFYKGGEKIFTAEDYGGAAKNYSGAVIDLSYLVPDLENLIASTKKPDE